MGGKEIEEGGILRGCWRGCVKGECRALGWIAMLFKCWTEWIELIENEWNEWAPYRQYLLY